MNEENEELHRRLAEHQEFLKKWEMNERKEIRQVSIRRAIAGLGLLTLLGGAPIYFPWCINNAGEGNRPVVEGKVYYRSAQAALLTHYQAEKRGK